DLERAAGLGQQAGDFDITVETAGQSPGHAGPTSTGDGLDRVAAVHRAESSHGDDGGAAGAERPLAAVGFDAGAALAVAAVASDASVPPAPSAGNAPPAGGACAARAAAASGNHASAADRVARAALCPQACAFGAAVCCDSFAKCAGVGNDEHAR